MNVNINCKYSLPLEITQQETGAYKIVNPNNSQIPLKNEEGVIVTAGKFPHIHKIIAAKPVNKNYEVLIRLTNGTFAKWIVDSSGYKQRYIDLEDKTLSLIEDMFNVDLVEYSVNFARNLNNQGNFVKALEEWRRLFNKVDTNFFEVCKKDGYIYEDIIKTLYARIVRKGDICVDGGANAGLHTIPLSKLLGEKGKVYAFEALPNIVARLNHRIEQNNLQNIKVIQKAIGNKHGFSKFYHVKNNPGLSGIAKRVNYPKISPEFEEIEVEVVKIDDFLLEEESWRFCKLDLEGGELFALQGAIESIRKFSPFIVFENGREGSARAYNYTSKDWFDFFKSIDYQIFDIFGNLFTPLDWKSSHIPCYFMAVKSGSEDEKFIINNFK